LLQVPLEKVLQTADRLKNSEIIVRRQVMNKEFR